jgi:hypothetical protein
MVVADSSQSPGEVVAEQMRFLNVVCMALIASVAAYCVVAWFMSSSGGGLAGPDLPNTLAAVGAAVAVGLLVAAPIVRRKTLEKSTAAMRADERDTTATENYRLATLLAFVLREGAAIVGLMLTIVTGEPMWTYALSAVTIVAMFAGWPRREELEAVLAGRPL